MTAALTQAVTSDDDVRRQERLHALVAETHAKVASLRHVYGVTDARFTRVDRSTELLIAHSRGCIAASLALLARCRA